MGQGGGRMSQTEAARALGVSQHVYSNLETGRTALLSVEAAARIAARIDWTEPTVPELLRLARRRHGLGSRGTAALLGITFVELSGREAAGEACLVDAWRALGYRFPGDG